MDKRRLSIEITSEEQIRMHNLIPWGVVSRIMRVLFIQTLNLVESHGEIVLGAILSGKLSALDLLRKEDTNEDKS
jgi:hypothetical protein